MSEGQGLGPFLGLRSATAGDVSPGYAGSLRNARVGDGWVRPRYGFAALAAAPAALESVHGLARLLGYGADDLPRREWVSIERRAGTVRPYAIDPTTWGRTAITDGGKPLALAEGDWVAFAYGGASYWVNPGGPVSVYRHEVGDPTSWTALQDSAYVPTAPTPEISADVRGPQTRPWQTDDALDHRDVSNFTKSTSLDLATDGSGDLLWHGGDDDNGKTGMGTAQILFADPLDLSGDVFAVTATGGTIISTFKKGTKIQLRLNGATDDTWSAAFETKEFLSPDAKSVALVVRTRGLAGADRVTGMRITFYGKPVRFTKGVGFTILPLALGGTYVGAALAAARVWDAPYVRTDVAYGVRYRDLATPSATGVLPTTLDASRFGTVVAGPSCPLGDGVVLSATPETAAPYVDDPQGTRFVMDVVRAGSDGKWRLLATLPNTDGGSTVDGYEAWEVDALPPLDGAGGYAAPSPAPVFATKGFVGGVPFKGWVAWLTAGGPRERAALAGWETRRR